MKTFNNQEWLSRPPDPQPVSGYGWWREPWEVPDIPFHAVRINDLVAPQVTRMFTLVDRARREVTWRVRQAWGVLRHGYTEDGW